ncbi:MAG TPA: ankyrin repeat domain-containing protein [Gammaproteobacteria bacterium]
MRSGLAVAAVVLVAAGRAFGAPLVDAARLEDHEKALALIEQGADVNEAAADGTTALHWAVAADDVVLVERLLAAGADPNAVNEFGATPMSEAAIVGNPDVIARLLDAGADPDSANEDGQTALMLLARTANVDAARLLLDHGANVDAREVLRGQTALMWAAAERQPEMMRLLIEHGADVDARSRIHDWERQVSGEPRAQYRPSGGLTPLLFAAREGCLECVRILLDAGADIDLPDPDGITPLIMAVANMHFDVAAHLVEAGADVNRWDWWGRTPLYLAVDVNTIPHGGRPDRPVLDETTSLELIEMLLEAGANPNAQLKLRPPFRSVGADRGVDHMLIIGTTPLLRAAKAFDTDAIRLLLEHGADPNLGQVIGITPVMAAAGLGSRDADTRGTFTTPDVQQRSIAALELLLDAGGNVNARIAGRYGEYCCPYPSDESLDHMKGQAAIHGAAFWGWNDVVEYLVSRGADIHVKDARGMTPEDAALGRAGGNSRGDRIDVHEDTAELVRRLMAATPQADAR